MVTYSHTVIDKQVEGFNRFARFVLIGNNIDGRVNVGLVEFEHFDDVKKKLPGLIAKLEVEGECTWPCIRWVDHKMKGYRANE